MRPRPYTGLTGITDKDTAYALLDYFARTTEGRLLMLGMLANNKTVYGQLATRPLLYPDVSRMGGIFVNHLRALQIVHFHTSNHIRLSTDMFEAQKHAGTRCHGIQLNMPWPTMTALGSYKQEARLGDKIVILQCGARAIAEADKSPRVIAAKVAVYAERRLVDYVLIDPSGGTGTPFKLDFAIECFKHLSDIPNIGLGIAGGLTPETVVDKLQPIIDAGFGDFSFDVETGVQQDGALCLDKCLVFLEAASRLDWHAEEKPAETTKAQSLRLVTA